METPLEGAQCGSGASFVIEHSLPASSRDAFLALQKQLHEAARQVSGYQAAVLEQVPTGRDDALHYRSTLSFDSADALLTWLDSDARRQLIEEGRRRFDYDYALHSSLRGFDGWFPHHDEAPPPRWKMNLLVLVTLYPTVLALGPLLRPLEHRVSAATSMLIGNILSVALTGWLLMPIANRCYKVWLAPRCSRPTQLVGTLSALLLLLAVWAVSRS